MSILEEKDVQFYSKEILYGDRDGIHLSGKEAPDILGKKLAHALRSLKLKQQSSKLVTKNRHNVSGKNLVKVIRSFETVSLHELTTPQINWNSSEDFPSLGSSNSTNGQVKETTQKLDVNGNAIEDPLVL